LEEPKTTIAEKFDKVVEEWLSSQKEVTQKAYRLHWTRFVEFTKMEGEQVLTSRREDKNFLWEKKALAFKAWLLNTKKLAPYTATAATQGIRSFFAYHHLKLEFRKTESRTVGQRTRKTEDYKFSLDDIRKMFDVADLEEKYVVTAGKSFGLRAGDFLRLTRGDLEPYIDRDPPISIGEYNTQKEGVNAFPFIDTDAQPVIKLVLERMTRDGRTGQNAKMVEFADEIQLTRVLKRVVKFAGINTGGKQVRFHCMRKFLIDHLSSFMSESKWKQIVGKQISEGAYVSADSLAKDYGRAMAETTFTKKASDDVQKIAKLEALKLFAKASGYTENDIAKIRMRKRNITTDEEIEEIERILAEKNKKEEACTNGKGCQQMVNEADLAKFLGEGWKWVATLQSGKIVIDS